MKDDWMWGKETREREATSDDDVGEKKTEKSFS